MTPSQWSFGIAPTKQAAIGTRWFSVFETTETKITFGAELQFFPWFHFSPHVYPQGWRMILLTHSRSLCSLIYISLNNKSILPCSLYAGSNVAVILPASSHPLRNQSFFSFFLDFIFLLTFILDLPPKSCTWYSWRVHRSRQRQRQKIASGLFSFWRIKKTSEWHFRILGHLFPFS